MSAITAKASRKMKKYAVLTREPRCFLGSFDFSWEQRKLGELGTITTGNTPSTSIPDYYSDDGIVWVTPTDICENITFESARKLSDLGQQVGRVVPKNTILVTCIASIGKNTMLGNTGSFNQQINGLTPNENKYDPYFLLTESALWSAKMKGSAASGTMQIVNRTEFSELKTWLPSLIEQQAIGAFFKQLDNLITLHQRKCALLFSPFQAFISMMFTTSTFSWEQRKLGELVDVCSGRDYKHLSEGTIPVYGTGGYMLSVNDALSYDRDAIGIGRKGTIDRPYILKAPFWTVDTLFYAIPREKVDLNFAFDIFQNIDWKKKDESTGVPSLSKTAINDIDVLAPKHGEQQTIGQFFAAIDHLITLHQRKCIFFTGRAGRLISTVNKKRITSSWEQRKLSEMCGTFEYGLNAAAKEFDGKNKYIRITDIDDASREFLLSDLSSPDICLDGMSKYLLSSGDIVFARTGASVGKTYIYRENDGIVYFAGFLIRAKVNQDNDAEFVFQSTLSPSYEKYIRITSQRSGQPGVNAQEYGEYDLFAPSKEEQQRIGHFLRGIANLITLHQRKPFLMKWRTSDANRNQTNRLVL